MQQLANKVALVTGASSGIGYATAKLFAHEGARIVVAARRREKLDALVDEIKRTGGQAVALAGDVRDEAYARALVATAVAKFGGLDIAFNNAGMLGDLLPAPEMSLANWQAALDTNLTSAFLGAKYQVPAMLDRNGGSLVFTSTFVGYTAGMPGTAAYAASKAGIIGLVQVLASEFGAKRIRANAILPGGTDTAMAQAMIGTPESRAFVEGLRCAQTPGKPRMKSRDRCYIWRRTPRASRRVPRSL